MAVGDKYFAVMKNELAVSNGVATLGPDGLLNASQRPITDSMPTQGSSNPVQSGGVYSALSNKVNQIIALGPEDDLNTITASGFYRLKGTTINVPSNCTWGTLIVAGDNNTVAQYISDHTNYRFLKRTARNSLSVWSEWVPIGTATTPQEFNLPLASGWSAKPGGLATYFRTQENLVCLNMNIASSSPISRGDLISTLPEGYRPSKQIKVSVVYTVAGQDVSDIGHLDIGSDGTIVIYNSPSGNEVISEISACTVVFIAT